MNSAHPQPTLFARNREVRVEPEVKSAKMRELFKAGVNGNRRTAKSADPTCYNAFVDQTKESDMRTFKTGDRVQWSVGDQAGDRGTVSRTYDRDGVDYFDVTWDDGEVIDYMDWLGTGCRKIGVAA